MRFRELSESKSLAGDAGDVIEYKGGLIDINTAPQYAPRGQSIVHFEVPELVRGQGIGDALLKMAMRKYKDLGGQVSSLASLKILHNNGFRNPQLPQGTFQDHVAEFHENGDSLFMAMNDSDGKPYVG